VTNEVKYLLATQQNASYKNINFIINFSFVKIKNTKVKG